MKPTSDQKRSRNANNNGSRGKGPTTPTIESVSGKTNIPGVILQMIDIEEVAIKELWKTMSSHLRGIQSVVAINVADGMIVGMQQRMKHHRLKRKRQRPMMQLPPKIQIK